MDEIKIIRAKAIGFWVRQNPQDKDEIEQLVDIAIFEAEQNLETMITEHPNPEAYIAKCAFGKVANWYYHQNKAQSILLLGDIFYAIYEDVSSQLQVDDFLKTLTPTERYVVDGLLQGYNLTEIGTRLKIHKSTVLRIRDRIRERLR